jgi:hypothetical protein
MYQPNGSQHLNGSANGEEAKQVKAVQKKPCRGQCYNYYFDQLLDRGMMVRGPHRSACGGPKKYVVEEEKIGYFLKNNLMITLFA